MKPQLIDQESTSASLIMLGILGYKYGRALVEARWDWASVWCVCLGGMTSAAANEVKAKSFD